MEPTASTPARYTGHTAKPRLLGSRAALNRYQELRGGRDLPPHKDAVLRFAARLLVHGQNVSNTLYYLGETRQDDEPRALLKELRELNALLLSNLRYCFPESAGEDAPDLFSKYAGAGGER